MFNKGDRVQFNARGVKEYPYFVNARGTIVSVEEDSLYGYLYQMEWSSDSQTSLPSNSGRWTSKLIELVPVPEPEETFEKFYIIWNPEYPAPPRVKFYDYKKPKGCVSSTYPADATGYSDAVKAAEGLAMRNPGEDFYVLEVKSLVKCDMPSPKTTQAK
jgi:hypothetical protein